MLNKLSDKNLLRETQNIVKREKQLTAKVLEYLQEVERRKVYADLGIHSLFAYCVKVLKYSEAEASIRVNAMRLICDVPEVKAKIEKGDMNITAASKVQSFFKSEKIDNKEKKAIINEVAGKSTRETERIIEKHSVKSRRAKSVILNERLLKKLDVIKESFEDEDMAMIEIVEALIDEKIEAINHAKKTRKSNKVSKNQRYIDRKTREFVDKRAENRCEYIAKTTGKRCTCRTNLQYEHVRAIGIGGQSTIDNLRKFCPTHNAREAIKDFGVKFIEGKKHSRDRSRKVVSKNCDAELAGLF